MTEPLRALVTGAARPGGIGDAIATRLRDDGLEVITLDREPGCTFTVDVTTGQLPDLHNVDVLVANAGLPTIFGPPTRSPSSAGVRTSR